MKTALAKAIVLFVTVALLSGLVADTAFAQQENKFVRFLKRVITYPFGVAKKSTEVTTDTATKAVGMTYETGKAAAGVATGDIKKTKDLVVEPVKGSAETVKTAVEGSVKMPVEAAQEDPFAK